MIHSHDHAHHAHEHDHDHGTPVGRENRLLFAFALTVLMLIAEAIGGVISHSLALLADAGHMLVDAGALMFAWLGAHYARRPADARRSFGYARLEVLVGYSNSLLQFLLVIWIASEALFRFASPEPILSGTMLVVALAGLVVNSIVLGALSHSHGDLNTASARLHVLGDLLGSAGAVVAALVVRYFDWLWADPLVSILVSLLILGSAWRLLRRSAHILLEGTPEGMDADIVGDTIQREASGVRDVHHVHIWQLAGGSHVATLHARALEGHAPDAVILSIRTVLRERFSVDHATVQLETFHCEEPGCRDAAASKLA
ncbi:MAG TPA: cation diffusion facilitator family transporter [Rhodanobacteraceae bacterium]|nr:cation diffusion facilitator family transporter [Rhodanobacteraceae bacterium]